MTDTRQNDMTPLTILILAAGASRRMRGADKLLLQVDGLPQLRRIALQAMATGRPVAVTVPADNPLHAAALQGLAVQIVTVPDCAVGISASLRAGHRALGDSAALMILPADLPELDTADLNTVIAAFASDPAAIHRGSSGNRAGHPVVLPQDILPSLANLTGDQGARGVIAGLPHRIKLCPLPFTHAILDLDTPEDWVAWHNARTPLQLALEDHPSMADPLAAAGRCPKDAVLAVVTSVTGASYRSPGAMMCLFGNGTSAGGLTNGCIEGDLAEHARTALATGNVLRLRYGTGSPFFDIRLPCGGGLDIALYPRPDPDCLAEIARNRARRLPFALRMSVDGRLSLQDARPTGWEGDDFIVNQAPATKFLIFGEGPEATVFARLVHAAGYVHHLATPSGATLAATLRSGCHAKLMTSDNAAPLLECADRQTAVVTFFHDHHRELPILHAALNGPAFYIGAQGSRRVAENRRDALRGLGVNDATLARLYGPIGLIPSTRDPKTLAISVLAEISAAAIDADEKPLP